MTQLMQMALSGPEVRADEARAALTNAGLRVLTDKDGKPLSHNWGHHSSHVAEWSGKRYEQGDIDALDAADPDHGHAVGDVVRGTGAMVPVPLPHVVAFLTVEGATDQIDRANPAVEPLGWRERGRWNYDPVPAVGDGLTDAQRLARVEADLNLLKGAK